MKIVKITTITIFLLCLINSYGTTTVSAPAVYYSNNTFEGDTVNIDITAKKGTGKVFVNIGPTINEEMQSSIKIAKYIAFKISNKNPNNYDLTYNIHSNAPEVGGPSAGGLLTIATICELNNWHINHSVMMTGTINPDGSIGKVGGVIEKIKASKTKNITLFLIPKGERFVNNDNGIYDNVNNNTNNNTNNTNNTNLNNTIDAVKFGEKLGITVIEVNNIYDAIYYFTNKKIELKQYSKNPIIEQKYKDISKKLYDGAIVNGQNKYNQIKERLNNISKNKNNTINNTELKILYSNLNTSKNILEEGKKYYNNRSYYIAVSKVFGALIILEQTNTSLNYYLAQNQTERKEFVKNYLDNTEKLIDEYKIIADNEQITENNVEYIIASQSRIYEGSDILKEARKQYNNGNLIDALNTGAYAKLRAISGIWWLSVKENNLINYNNLTKKLVDNNINEGNFVIIAYEYLNNAQKYYYLSYTSLPESSINDIQKELTVSKTYYDNGQYLLSISKSIDIIVTCETYFSYLSDINYIENITTNKINEVEQLNSTPILALCYREFSNNSKDRISKIYYLKYSYYYAQLNKDILENMNYNTIKNLANKGYIEYINNNNNINNNYDRYNDNKDNNNIIFSSKIYKNYLMVIVWSLVLLIAGAYFGALVRNK